jgi:ABC-type glycerol-3-phosphate transport system permease component
MEKMPGISRNATVWRSVIRHGLLILMAFIMLYPLLWMAASSTRIPSSLPGWR